jgi:putative inorganic carbon (HCO3(-)) transporter
MDKKRQNIEMRMNGIVVFFYCLLIYFLPISIALTESLAGFVIVSFLIKKVLLNIHDIRDLPGPVTWQAKRRVIVESLKIPAGNLNKPVVFFLLASLLSVFHSQYFTLSLVAFLGKIMEGYFLLFSFADCFKTKQHIRNFIAVYLVVTLLMGINGVVQYITHTEFVRGTPLILGRISSSLRHANDFGAYLLFVIPVLLSLIFMPLNRWSWIEEWKTKQSVGSAVGFKILLGLLFLLIVTCEGLTFSRGSWVGFIFSLFALALFRKRGFLPGTAVVVIFMVIFLPFLTQTRDVSFVSDNVTIQENVDQQHKPKDFDSLPPIERWIEANKHFGFSGMGRAGFWTEAVSIIKRSPVLGSGLNTYSRMGTRYGYAHNCYLQMAAETGILGLISFLVLITFLFAEAVKSLPAIRDHFLKAILAGCLAGLVGFLIQSFLDTSFYSVQLGNLMWIFIGVIVAVQRLSKTQNN